MTENLKLQMKYLWLFLASSKSIAKEVYLPYSLWRRPRNHDLMIMLLTVLESVRNEYFQTSDRRLKGAHIYLSYNGH